MFWVFSELLITALLITSKLIAINMLRSTNDHYIPLLLHAEGTKDLAEILSERESIAHTMQVFFTMQVYFCIIFGRLFLSCRDSPMSAPFSLSLCVSEPSDQKRAAQGSSDKTKN